MAKLFANSGDSDQMPHSAASDLGLHCLPFTLLRVFQLQWVKKHCIHGYPECAQWRFWSDCAGHTCPKIGFLTLRLVSPSSLVSLVLKLQLAGVREVGIKSCDSWTYSSFALICLCMCTYMNSGASEVVILELILHLIYLYTCLYMNSIDGILLCFCCTVFIFCKTVFLVL